MAVNSRALGKTRALSLRAANSTKSKPAPKQTNQAGRPTAAELERRKALAIDVATDLFVTHGYAATSLVDIAKGAGVATRTIYQHFGDKEAMFREVIFARDTETVLQPPLVEPGDTLFSALSRVADYAYSVTFRERSIGLMRLMIAESNRFPDFMRSIVNSIYGRFRQNIRKMFSSLELAGLIPPGDHKRSAELFSDLILHILARLNWPTRTRAATKQAPAFRKKLPTTKTSAAGCDCFLSNSASLFSCQCCRGGGACLLDMTVPASACCLPCAPPRQLVLR
jgi:AcrR family transcriptional regulator